MVLISFSRFGWVLFQMGIVKSAWHVQRYEYQIWSCAGRTSSCTFKQFTLVWFCHMIPDLHHGHRQGVRLQHHPLWGRAGHTTFCFATHMPTTPSGHHLGAPPHVIREVQHLQESADSMHVCDVMNANPLVMREVNVIVGLRAICHYQGLVPQSTS